MIAAIEADVTIATTTGRGSVEPVWKWILTSKSLNPSGIN